jgi:hypothetical protein
VSEDLSPRQIQQLKHQELRLKQQKMKIMENLPHRYGMKHYPWSRKFYESTNKMNLLVAANQIGKSSGEDSEVHRVGDERGPLAETLWKKRPQSLLVSCIRLLEGCSH